MEVDWVGYQLDPEVPAEGVLVSTEFPKLNMQKMIGDLNKEGAPYGIKFNPFERIPNTRLALIASEIAREMGRYEPFHQQVFEAIFVEGRDIGRLDTILACAKSVGLDPAVLEQRLPDESYALRLEQGRELAKKHKVAGLPAFIIGEQHKLVGIKPYQVFVGALSNY